MRQDYLAAGMDDDITKPFQPSVLLAKLAELSNRAGTAERETAKSA